MIAQRLAITDQRGNTKVTYKRHTIQHYTKSTVLRALVMYNRHHIRAYPILVTRSNLFRARFVYGQQFLIDLFVLTEVYMNKYPNYAMNSCRNDIMYILSALPNYRIMYENN